MSAPVLDAPVDDACAADTGDLDWDGVVAQVLAGVAEQDAATQELLEQQPDQSCTYALPVPDGATSRIPAWRSRQSWLDLLGWALTTDRGCAAVRKHEVAARTVLTVAEVSASYADARTGRRMYASIDTLLRANPGLSRDQVKRARRVLRALEFGADVVLGKKLNEVERAAAAELGCPGQCGAGSVWVLSEPRWAVTSHPGRPYKPARKPRRRRVSGSAPQSSSSSLKRKSLVRSTHQRARERTQATKPKSVQRAAAELLRRIPDLAAQFQDRHVGAVCTALTHAGIDTARWHGRDIARALDADAINSGWHWPTHVRDALALLRFRLARIDFTGPSPTERDLSARCPRGVTPTEFAYHLTRTTISNTQRIQALRCPPPTIVAPPQHRDIDREPLPGYQAFQQARARLRRQRQ